MLNFTNVMHALLRYNIIYKINNLYKIFKPNTISISCKNKVNFLIISDDFFIMEVTITLQCIKQKQTALIKVDCPTKGPRRPYNVIAHASISCPIGSIRSR